MRWPRLTTRRIMGLVFVLAVALGLGIPAVEVARDKGYHVHCWVQETNGRATLITNGAIPSPFWSRYWRRLLGRPWHRLPVCGSGEGHLAESCIFEHPEILGPIGLGGVRPVLHTPDLRSAFDQLEKSLSPNQTPGRPESAP